MLVFLIRAISGVGSSVTPRYSEEPGLLIGLNSMCSGMSACTTHQAEALKDVRRRTGPWWKRVF